MDTMHRSSAHDGRRAGMSPVLAAEQFVLSQVFWKQAVDMQERRLVGDQPLPEQQQQQQPRQQQSHLVQLSSVDVVDCCSHYQSPRPPVLQSQQRMSLDAQEVWHGLVPH